MLPNEIQWRSVNAESYSDLDGQKQQGSERGRRLLQRAVPVRQRWQVQVQLEQRRQPQSQLRVGVPRAAGGGSLGMWLI